MSPDQIDDRIEHIRSKIANIPNMGFGKQEAADKYQQALEAKISLLEREKTRKPEPSIADLMKELEELKDAVQLKNAKRWLS